MRKDLLAGLQPFLAVSEHRSFSRAAQALDVSPTAISKAIRELERRHGVLLFRRTTRSVSFTEAGAALYDRLRPAGAEIEAAFAALGPMSQRPTGTLRLTMSRTAYRHLVAPIVAAYRTQCPDVTLELSLDEGFADLATGAFDAGIRQGESVEKDMVAVRLTPPVRWAVAASPAYLARHDTPRRPEELMQHEAIHYRFIGARTRHRWEFARDGQAFTVDPPGHLTANDRVTLAALACNELGLAYLSDLEAAADIAAGRLVPFLQAFIPPSSGLFLYFPTRTQQQPKLRAFIDPLTAR